MRYRLRAGALLVTGSSCRQRAETQDCKSAASPFHRAFTQFALHFDFAAVQIDAALYDHQTETRTRTVTDVMPAMEGVEEPLSVGFWNSDALVADSANNFCFVTPDFESNQPPGVRILHRVR